MADECVPASPIGRKARKRKGSLLHRRAKRHRGRESKSLGHKSVTSATDETNQQTLSHKCEEDLKRINQTCGSQSIADITSLYWPEEEHSSILADQTDIFAEALLLEQANAVPVKNQSKIPPNLLKNEFSSLNELSQQISKCHEPVKNYYETQFVTESELVRVCEVADAITDLHRGVPVFSQWDSPFNKAFTSTPAPERKVTNVEDKDLDENAAQTGSQLSCISSSPDQIVHNSQKPGTSFARRIYGRDIEKAASKRKIFFDDSDSKSSLSELSQQSNEGIEFTPLDQIDLNKSIHVHKNLQNLSFHFSQSFDKDDVDSTTNGVFRYIMLLKSRRKDARMIQLFRSGKNFEVNRSASSRSFDGFPLSEVAESTVGKNNSSDVHNLLEEDDEFFAEFSDDKTLKTRGNSCMDIESVLTNADSLLQRLSQMEARTIGQNEDCDRRLQEVNKENEGFNIDSLLHGKILETPRMAKFSENSVPEPSPFKWIMRPKIQNSITASDIEFESEAKEQEPDIEDKQVSPTLLNATFTISTSTVEPKSPILLQTAVSTKLDAANDEGRREPNEYVVKRSDNMQIVGNISAKGDSVIEETLRVDYYKNDNIMRNINAESSNDLWNNKRNYFNNKPESCGGFKSASGKPIFISKKALAAAEKVMAEEILVSQISHTSNHVDGKTELNVESGIHLDKFNEEKVSPYRIAHNSSHSVRNKVKDMQPHPKHLMNQTPFFAPDFMKVISDTSPGPLRTGFTSASGKNLFISAAAQKKAQRIAAECDNESNKFRELSPDESELHENHMENIEQPTGNASNVIKRASVRCLARQQKSASASNEVESVHELEMDSANKIAIGSERKDIPKGCQKSKIIYDENVTSPKSSSLLSIEGHPIANETKTFSGGFQSASGKRITISEQAKQKAMKMMMEEMTVEVSNHIDIAEHHSETPKSKAVASIVEPSVLIKQDNNRSDLNQDLNFGQLTKAPIQTPSNFRTGFQTASGSAIKISDTAKAKALKMMTEIENECEDSGVIISSNQVPASNALEQVDRKSITGFLSPFGKAISVSENDFVPVAKEMAEEDDDILMNLKFSQLKYTSMKNTHKNSEEHPRRESSNHCHSLTTDNAPKRVTRSNSIESCVNPSKLNFNETPGRVRTPLAMSPIENVQTPNQNKQYGVTSKNPLTLSKKRLRDAISAPEKPLTPIRSVPFPIQVDTPNLHDFFESVQTSTPKNVIKFRARKKITLSQEVSASTAALLEDEAEIKDNQSSLQKIPWMLGINGPYVEEKSASGNIEAYVISERTRKRDEQLNIIKSKTNFRGFVKSGELYTKKMLPNRMKLQDLWRNSFRPTFPPVSLSDLVDFRFKVSNEMVMIPIEDNSYIVPDNNSMVGLDQIKNAFLSLPSVAVTLVPFNWIQHHYKMILLKFHWLESIWPGFLTAQNVCLQLKYRYDYEIDQTHRSALRRILEHDDSPSKRMILSVIALYHTSLNMELELSDGWYSIKTTIDPAMQSMIDSGKVRTGTKLMIQSAELLNCEEGCSPLGVPEHVRLKIHTNSTRRARWDTKLGLFKTQNNFILNLRQVSMFGKLITKLKLFVIRVYPSLFRKASKYDGNVSEFHSEIIERQLKRQADVAKLSNIELIFSQVQQELDAERKQSKSRKIASNVNIRKIDDPAELYELLQWDGDSSEIVAELSSDQRKLLTEYQQKLHAQRLQEVQKRVQSRLQDHRFEQNTKELLKLRVIDYRNPEKTALFSIWSPHQEIKNMLQESIAMEVTHVMPNEHHSFELQLTSTKMSQFKILKATTNRTMHRKQVGHIIPAHFLRHVTSIQEIQSPNFKPAFNELDTCGLIVAIENRDGGGGQGCQAKRFQPVYMTDCDDNILCLNFWIGVKDYGYEDVIQLRRFVAANNLQWRSNSGIGPIPTAFVSNITLFTENPKNKDMIHALDAMKARFRSKFGENTQEFIEHCQERIKEIKSRPKSLPASSLNGSSHLNNYSSDSSMHSFTSTSMNASTSFSNSTMTRRVSVQERIDKLKMYGNPPEISPIQVKRTRSVRRGFKVPSRLAGCDDVR